MSEETLNRRTSLRFRLLFILADENAELRKALEEIDAVAVGKKAGAAKRMQEIARKALAPQNGDR